MKYFKKYPLFFALMTVLLAGFAGMVGYDIYLGSESGKFSKKLSREMSTYKTALGDDPTEKAIDASNANIKKLEAHLAFLEKDLTRASDSIFRELTAKEGYQLVEQLRGFVNSWRKDARKRGIDLSDDMDFGFKKYVAPNADSPKDEAIPALWKQVCVLNPPRRGRQGKPAQTQHRTPQKRGRTDGRQLQNRPRHHGAQGGQPRHNRL